MEQEENKYIQLCVWEGVLIEGQIKEFEEMILQETDCRIKYECEVKTLPGDEGEGGRNDVFFYVHSDDLSKFAIRRLRFGIRWWEDVLGNGHGCLYPQEIREKYPNAWAHH